MCNDPVADRDSIEMTLTIKGLRFHFKRELPSVVRSSSGSMSIRAGLEPIAIRLLHEAMDELLYDATISLDHAMPHPRIVWWQLDQSGQGMDEEA